MKKEGVAGYVKKLEGINSRLAYREERDKECKEELKKVKVLLPEMTKERDALR